MKRSERIDISSISPYTMVITTSSYFLISDFVTADEKFF